MIEKGVACSRLQASILLVYNECVCGPTWPAALGVTVS